MIGIWQAVESGLSARFGGTVRIVAAQNLGPSQVFRCMLQSSASDAPNTVIVRLPREGEGERSGSAPLDRERAALEYLTAIDSSLAPRFFAGGAESGFVASEDLGEGPSLLDLLLGKDPEAATEGVFAFARTLGKLHARTVGRNDAPANLAQMRVPVVEHWQQVKEAITRLGLPSPSGNMDQSVAEIDHLLNDSGDWPALSSGDISVVNCKANRGTVRFFDFEGACFRHALVDAVVLRFPYPTGGPVWCLPPKIAHRIEAVYRRELAIGCPAAAQGTDYESGMAASCAAWMILRLARLPRVDAGPDRDSWTLLPPDWSAPIPTRSRRRQLVSILETCVAPAYRAHIPDALADWCERLIEALRIRWPEATEELPLYPVYR